MSRNSWESSLAIKNISVVAPPPGAKQFLQPMVLFTAVAVAVALPNT